VMLVMSVSTFSQKSSPRWIASPSGDTLLGFNSEHVDILGEKLILKSYLVQRNYELMQLNDLMQSRCNALSSALEERMDEVAVLDGEIALCEQRIQSLNNEIERLDKAVQREERRKKFWKVAAISEGGILLLVVGGVLLAL
jgi:maltooligosyltrehalose synthase